MAHRIFVRVPVEMLLEKTSGQITRNVQKLH
jgi:hypothetical protein